MLSHNIFYVATKECDALGRCAIAGKVSANNNLVGFISGFETFNVCKTMKEAEKLAILWNNDFRNNGSQYK
jgi:hypothetical protein